MSLSSGLIKGCFGAALGFKTEENENVLRFYGFEGESGGRGRSTRASTNQNVAGTIKDKYKKSVTPTAGIRPAHVSLCTYDYIILYI